VIWLASRTTADALDAPLDKHGCPQKEIILANYHDLLEV
jgi:hypothetical protein